MNRTRICLVAPSPLPADFDLTVAEALDAGDVASLLIDPAGADKGLIDRTIRAATSRGVAAVIVGTTAPPAADGVHVETGAKDVAAARASLGEERIVGAGGIGSRHDAMSLGERLPDYLFFGRFDGDTEPDIHPKALDLASWWAQLFQIPAMVMGGSEVGSIAAAAAAGIEFIALRNAVWNHPSGAASAVADANAILDEKATA